MDFRYTPEQETLRKEYDEFFREEMKNAPSAVKVSTVAWVDRDESWEFHRQIAKKLAARGWISIAWPKEYGGQDAPLMQQFIFNQVRGYHRAPGILPMGVDMIAPTLLAAANEDQKREHLPPIARAEREWCQLWSEPNAGSDLASLTTRAVRSGDEYIVNGQKIWTTGAHRADWGFMLARTNPEEKRSKGLSFFLVDMKTPGITVSPIYSIGKHHHLNEVFFDDVHVRASNRIGEENKGWMVSRMTSNFERSGIGELSRSRGDFEELAEFCRETMCGGQPLAKNTLVRHRLARLAIEIEACVVMSYSVVWNQVKGDLMAAAPIGSAVKLISSELRQRLAYTACEILGLYSQVKTSRWAQLYGKYEEDYQECLGFNLAGGTSEVQRNLIAALALGLPRSW